MMAHKLICKFALISTLFGIPAQAFTDTAFLSITCHFANKSVQSVVYKNDFNGVVKWLPEAGFPIGMNAVRVNAEKAFIENFANGGSPAVQSINLVHIQGIDDWVFEVTLSSTMPDLSAPTKIRVAQITLIELLNGKVIKPTVTTVIPPAPNSNHAGSLIDGDHPYPDLYVPDLHPLSP